MGNEIKEPLGGGTQGSLYAIHVSVLPTDVVTPHTASYDMFFLMEYFHSNEGFLHCNWK